MALWAYMELLKPNFVGRVATIYLDARVPKNTKHDLRYKNADRGLIMKGEKWKEKKNWKGKE